MIKWVFIMAAILASVCTRAQNLQAVIDSLDKACDEFVAAGHAPGIMIGIWDGNKDHYITAGYADDSSKMAWDEETNFEAGSITKTLTAYLLEKALKNKNIADTSSILTYLPDSLRTNRSLERINFLMLMNHTAGLPRLPDDMNTLGSMQPYEGYGEARLFSFLKNYNAESGEIGRHAYSNLGAALAGALAQEISGKPYEKLMEEWIFDKWKVGDFNAKNKKRATGVFDKNVRSAFWNMDAFAPAGGLVCDAKEMLNYLAYMAEPKKEKDKEIIDQLLSPSYPINKNLSIGRGWFLIERENAKFAWHNGGTYGFSTFAAFSKERNKAVIVAVNAFNKNEMIDKIGAKAITRLINLP